MEGSSNLFFAWCLCMVELSRMYILYLFTTVTCFSVHRPWGCWMQNSIADTIGNGAKLGHHRNHWFGRFFGSNHQSLIVFESMNVWFNLESHNNTTDHCMHRQCSCRVFADTKFAHWFWSKSMVNSLMIYMSQEQTISMSWHQYTSSSSFGG